nr:hypothetical protein CFP56_13448 [Quercus suber]
MLRGRTRKIHHLRSGSQRLSVDRSETGTGSTLGGGGRDTLSIGAAHTVTTSGSPASPIRHRHPIPGVVVALLRPTAVRLDAFWLCLPLSLHRFAVHSGPSALTASCLHQRPPPSHLTPDPPIWPSQPSCTHPLPYLHADHPADHVNGRQPLLHRANSPGVIRLTPPIIVPTSPISHTLDSMNPTSPPLDLCARHPRSVSRESPRSY